MAGRFVGYGAISEAIISGTLTLKKSRRAGT